ncbi:MAG: thiamine biosynthesis protein ThiF [Frankiaceae bacterium]
MRPVLKPALVRLWRDGSTVQFGADPAGAVVVAGVSAAVRRLLDLLDGTRDKAGVIASAASAGVAPADAARVLDRLSAAGLLEDGSADTAVLRALEAADRDRLAPELAALSLLRPGPGAALAALARRRAHHVALLGRLPLATELQGLLLAAGVGRVSAHRDPLRLLAETHLRRPPDLLVLTGSGTVAPDLREAADRLGVAHLAVVLRELTGVVGPLVRPGTSSCLHCHDLHRADRDPAWPALVIQLASATAPRPAAPAVLASLVTGAAALQALAHADGDRPATVDGTLELTLPDWRWRRRSWRPHPDCSCGAVRAEGASVRA